MDAETRPARPNLDFEIACLLIGPVLNAARDGTGLTADEVRELAEKLTARMQPAQVAR